jgi:hypothetical protein
MTMRRPSCICCVRRTWFLKYHRSSPRTDEGYRCEGNTLTHTGAKDGELSDTYFEIPYQQRLLET